LSTEQRELTPDQRAVCLKAASDLQSVLGFVRQSSIDIVAAVRAGKIRGLRIEFEEEKK